MSETNGIEIVPYVEDHFFQIVRREHDIKSFMGLPHPEMVAKMFTKGPGFTGIKDGEVVASAGVMIIWDRVGEAWTVTSPLVNKYASFFHKTIKDHLDKVINQYRLERVQCFVDKENKMATKWAEKLGFEYEGEMRKFFQGKTYLRYSRITEGLGG